MLCQLELLTRPLAKPEPPPLGRSEPYTLYLIPWSPYAPCESGSWDRISSSKSCPAATCGFWSWYSFDVCRYHKLIQLSHAFFTPPFICIAVLRGCLFFAKAHDGIRTRDLFLTKEVLYRLSYMGPSADPLQPPFANEVWSGRRDSNPRPQAWKACALPTELLPLA
jgi:hypothetical protein